MSLSHKKPSATIRRFELGMQILDSMWLKLNIDYPTDWVPLRDATRTLMKATIVISAVRTESTESRPGGARFSCSGRDCRKGGRPRVPHRPCQSSHRTQRAWSASPRTATRGQSRSRA
jgi:hypothetical protein